MTTIERIRAICIAIFYKYINAGLARDENYTMMVSCELDAAGISHTVEAVYAVCNQFEPIMYGGRVFIPMEGAHLDRQVHCIAVKEDVEPYKHIQEYEQGKTGTVS